MRRSCRWYHAPVQDDALGALCLELLPPALRQSLQVLSVGLLCRRRLAEAGLGDQGRCRRSSLADHGQLAFRVVQQPVGVSQLVPQLLLQYQEPPGDGCPATWAQSQACCCKLEKACNRSNSNTH